MFQTRNYNWESQQRLAYINKLQEVDSIIIKFLNGISIEFTKETLLAHKYTLEMIDIAKSIIKAFNIDSIADVGTGSGIISIFCAYDNPNLAFYASDVSKEALEIVKKNTKRNRIKNIEVLHNTDGIWLSELKNHDVSLIISNPPFLGSKEFEELKIDETYPELHLEPTSAIYSGDEIGLKPYLDIIENSNSKVEKILFYCNKKIIPILTQILEEKRLKYSIYKDSDNCERFLLIDMN